MLIFNELIVKEPCSVSLDGEEYRAVLGKHCIWIPSKGIKFIWSRNGKIESYRDWAKGRNAKKLQNCEFNYDNLWDKDTIKSIVSEYVLMQALAEKKMAPPIGKPVFVKNVISTYIFGVMNCDPRGMYGYEMADAARLGKTNSFDAVNIRECVEKVGVNPISDGAIGDLLKADNRVNGFLVDIRRTIWDMITLSWSNKDIKKVWALFRYEEDTEKLLADIQQKTQFPAKQRKQNYQSFLMGNTYHSGSRETVYRMEEMGVPKDLTGKSILDLGCNLGAMCLESVRRGAVKVTGIEYEADYVDCARSVARHNHMGINFMQADLMRASDIIDYCNKFFNGHRISIVFALSLYKHIGDVLWTILNSLDWEMCFVESHNAPKGLDTDHVVKMVGGMNTIQNAVIDYLGQTNDRSPRCIWKLTK